MTRAQIESRIAELKVENEKAPGGAGTNARAELIRELEAQLPCSAESCELRWARPMGATFDSMRKHVWETGLADIGDTILIWVNEGDFWEAMIKGVRLKEYKNPDGSEVADGAMGPSGLTGDTLKCQPSRPEGETTRPAGVTLSPSGVTFTDAQAVEVTDEMLAISGLNKDWNRLRDALEDIWALTSSFSQYTLEHFAGKVRSKVEVALASSQPSPAATVETVGMTYNTIKAAFDEYRKTLTVMDTRPSFDSFSQGYVAGWNAKEAQPHNGLSAGNAGDFERVFRDACDEAGCAYDNEALLKAIADLKTEHHCRKCGAGADERFDCCEVHALTSTEPQSVGMREALENLLQRIDDHFGGYRGGKWDWKEQADARIALSHSRGDK